ncbi:hypothetical protein [Lutibacter sp.]|uniref:hypothetical protein n=1 Tax=Lutibacter sp. TaxID=1925666 RepID=UPI003565F2F2
MTAEQITELFNQEVAKIDFGKRAGIDRRNVYKYRNSTNISLGTMLQCLYKAGAITIQPK